MPSSTLKQARTMAMAAHDPEIAKRLGIPMKVAKEFNRSDSRTGQLSRAMKDRSLKRDSGANS